MAKKPNVNVSPNGDGNWKVKSDNAEKADSIHPTQGDAIERGRDIARNRGSELVIRRPNGQIRDKDSYGNDPNPPKDKR